MASPVTSPSAAPPRPSTAILANDVFREERHVLEPFFRPRAVAVIGASERSGSVGRTLLHNLTASSFAGPVHPVNPRLRTVLGREAYPSIADVPGPIDLAVIATPAAAVPAVAAECAGRGIPAAAIISAGFGEVGAAGAALGAEVLAAARRGGMRIIGPNCLGVMCPPSGLNATFAAAMARPGKVAFLSQSGALLTAILDWSLRERVGFSAFVSLGGMLDVGWGELIDYLGNDARTRAIVMYMESIGDARAFLSAAREVALTKPVIVIKAGRSEAASRAACSHTGALTGADDVLDAAFRRSGVLRVNDIAEVFHLAEVLGKQPRPTGPRLAIVTNAGGPGVIATDALIGSGGQLAVLEVETMVRLDAALPAAWSHANPVDILGDADPARYQAAFELAATDRGSDGLLAILTPQDMTEPTAIARALARRAHVEGKPVLASWMGGEQVAAGVAILNEAGIPTFSFPDDAARTFCDMWRYADNLRRLYETPVRRESGAVRPAAAGAVVDAARAEGRTLLDEHESKAILASYGIPVATTRVASDADEAVALAVDLGFPVVLKLWSRTITHKSDVGGVKLALSDGAGVAAAFREIERAVTAKVGRQHFLGVTVQPHVERGGGLELIVGSSTDPQLGPVLLFGAGGALVEVLGDRALALPPLTTTLARYLMAETRIARAFAGVRGGEPIDVEAVAALLVRFGDLVIEQPRIREIEINPLLATGRRLLALDARVLLHAPEVPDAALPRPAIRPYPTEYVFEARLRDGSPMTIRPIRPEDEPLMVAFHRTLGERSVRMRYLQGIELDQRTAHERLVRVCFGDYAREIALVAERDAGTAAGQIIAVGRLSRNRLASAADEAGAAAEFSLLVGDPWQDRGVGRELLTRLIEVGRAERLTEIYADVLTANLRMQRLCAELGFSFGESDDEVVRAVRKL